MQKRAARRSVRALAFLLCLLMVVSLLPVMGANAADGGNEVSPAVPAQVTNGLTLNKTLTEDTSGNYKLVLEAYATGAVTSTTSTTPTDVVLLLDVSGSMSDSITTVTVKNADKTLGQQKGYYKYEYDGDTYDVQYRNGKWQYNARNRWHDLEDNATVYVSGSDSRIAALKTAAKSFIDATAAKNAVITDPAQQHRISIVKFAGTEKDTIGNDTYEDYWGYTYNNTQIVKGLTVVNENGKTELKNAVNALTAAGATSADYGLNRAAAALQNSGDDRAKVIVLFTDGEPNHKNGFDTSVAATAVNKAKTLKDAGTTIFTISVLDGSDPAQNPTSSGATNMNKYMQAVSSNYPEATAKNSWGNNSWDDLTFNNGNYQAGYYKKASSAAELSSIFTEISNSVGGTTVTLDGNAVLRDIISSDFTLPEGFGASSVEVQTADYQGNGKFAAPVKAASGITASVNGSTVDVTGFSYKDHYVVDASSDGQVKAGGQKLIVTINGLIPVDSRGTDVKTYSNDAASGIYTAASDTEPFIPFNQPWTKIPVYTKVLDFSMMANIATNVKQRSTATDTYGNFSTTGDLTYQLKNRVSTGNLVFDGVDSVLFYGNYNADNDELSRWNKVNVIPANNVYFDDDLLNEQSTFTDGDYGFDSNELFNGLGVTDDTTSYTNKDGSKTFTFKGTGIDVYCTTRATSGWVEAEIQHKDGTSVEGYPSVLMNNKFQNDAKETLYNVPTLSFTGLDYGEYKLVITVVGTATYELDGVRIYNPAGETGVVKDAYAADTEANAKFYNVRGLLLSDPASLGDEGVVFVDTSAGPETDVSVYEKNGPKNEVYLDTNELVAFQLADGRTSNIKVMVGLSAPAKSDVTKDAEVTVTSDGVARTIPVSSATDMYYEVTPDANGNVVIKNTGNALISVTNIKVTDNGSGAASQARIVSSPELMAYVSNFDTLEVVQPEPEPTPDPEPPVNNTSVSAIIRAIWTQVMDGIGKLFGRL